MRTRSLSLMVASSVLLSQAFPCRAQGTRVNLPSAPVPPRTNLTTPPVHHHHYVGLPPATSNNAPQRQSMLKPGPPLVATIIRQQGIGIKLPAARLQPTSQGCPALRHVLG